MPSNSGNTHRKVGDVVGWLMWFGTVAWWWANGWRHRRCATESTRQASVITIKSPWIRQGLLTNNDETKNSGSLSNRQPPSTRDWRVSAAMTSVSPHALAPILVPITQQA
jgi:hypothetical protein